MARFRKHVESPKFKAEDLEADAQAVSLRLDKITIAKSAPLIDPNDPTVPLLAKTLKRTRDEKNLPPITDLSPEAVAKREAAEKRRTVKAMLISVRAKKMVVKRGSRKEKFDRIKARKLEKLSGEGVTPEMLAKKAEAKRIKKE